MNDTEKEFICNNAPCYIYNKAEIIKQCEKLKKAMPGVQFLYSVKANPFLPVVSTITNCGLGVDAASSQEVVLANANRLTDGQIFYSSPGKTAHDIKQAFGKCIFIADSFHELELLNFHAGKAGKTIKAGVRINPGFGMDNSSLTEKELEPLYTAENTFHVSVLNGETEKETATVVGNLCTALDIIAENIELLIARIGDIVSVSNAGSYGYSLSPLLFGGHQAPKQFLWE